MLETIGKYVPSFFVAICSFALVFLFFAGHAHTVPILLEEKKTTPQSMLQAVQEDISRQQGTVITLQRELVAFAAMNPEHGGQGEAKKARWIAQWLHQRGIHTIEELDFPDTRVESNMRPNLIVTFPEKRTTEGKPMLWLFARLDVPPPGPLSFWESPPFTLRVRGDTLYGRGVEDNNQAIVTGLILLEALKRQGAAPPVDFGLVLVTGALVDFSHGIERILNDRAELFRKDDLFMLLHYGNPDGSLIEVAEKMNVWFRVEVTGQQAYAGNPEKATNAFAAAIDLAKDLPTLGQHFPDTSPMFHTKAVFTPTQVECGSLDANTIPGLFSFYIDVRIDPGYALEAPKAALLELARAVEAKHGVLITVEQVVNTQPAPPTPKDAPIIRALQRAIQKQMGVQASLVGIDGASMATALRVRGFPVAVWGMLNNLRNKSNEYMSVTAHLHQAKVLSRILFDTPGQIPAEKRSQPLKDKQR